MSLIFHPEQSIKYSGDNTYAFSLETKRENSAILAIIATATYQSLPIPISCTWKRLINKREYLIPTKKSNVYQPSCEDIRCRIIVEVEALDPHDGVGKAIAITPKLLIDALVRKNLENILQQGFGKFVTSFSCESLIDKVLESTLEISKEILKLNVFQNDGSLSQEFSVSTSYSVGFPQIVLHFSDCKRLILILEDNKPKITLQCLSRTSRDLIVMTMRVFSIENYLLHSKALENISSGQAPTGKIEIALELEEVISQLNLLSSENSELIKERTRYKKELIDMEKEMENTIEAYKNLLGCHGIDSNYDKEIEKIKNELNDAISYKQKSRKKMRKKKEEIEELKKNVEEMKESQQNLVWELKETKEKGFKPDYTNFEEKIARLEQELLQKDTQIEVISRDLLIKTEKIQDLKKEIEGKSIENSALSKEIVEHSNLLQDLAQLKNQNEALLGQRSFLSKKIENLTNENIELNSKLLKEAEFLKENQVSLEEENKKLKIEIENLKEEKKDDSNSINLKQTQEEVIKYRQQCDNLAAQLSRLQAQLRKNK